MVVENLNMRRLRSFVALLVVCLAAAGCSLSKLGYEALPTLAQWEIDRYLDLDEQQREIVARRLDGLHRWHRNAQLPEYVGFLREVDDRVRTPVDAAQVGRWRDRVGEAWAALAERLAPGVVELAVTLRPEQIERMRKRMAASNEKFRESHMAKDPAERETARGDRVVKRAEFFLGKLSPDQARHLRAMAAAMPPTEDAWLAEREARQKRLVDLMVRIRRDAIAAEAANQMVREHLLGFWESRDAQRRQRLERAMGASDAMTAEMVAQANTRQREHLSKLLRGYASDFEALSGGGTRTASR